MLEVANSVPGCGDSGGGDGDPPADPPSEPTNGVGLTVVDSVLAAHGGDLSWDTTEPGRVTASVRLPAARALRPAGRRSPA